MRNGDHRIYRSFEEFEREELNRMESVGATVNDMIDTLFGEELDFEATRVRRGYDDDEE